MNPFAFGPEDALASIEQTPTVFALEVQGSGDQLAGQRRFEVSAQRLNHAESGTSFHLGQPVMIGENRYVLRVALGAPLVTEIATNETWGENLSARLGSLAGDDRTIGGGNHASVRIGSCRPTELNHGFLSRSNHAG